VAEVGKEEKSSLKLDRKQALERKGTGILASMETSNRSDQEGGRRKNWLEEKEEGRYAACKEGGARRGIFPNKFGGEECAGKERKGRTRRGGGKNDK